MDWTQIVLMFVTLLISLTFHEAAHATFAMLGGDRTAYHGGQVSLNPIPHIRREPFGTVVLPLLGLFLSGGSMCIGFASTPIDARWAYQHPRRAALMSAAGPLANAFLAALAFGALYYIGLPADDTARAVRRIAATFLLLNVFLGLLNLIPVPPLDGSGVVMGLFPQSRRLFGAMAQIPYFSLVLLIGVLYGLPQVFWPVLRTVNGWLPYPYRF